MNIQGIDLAGLAHDAETVDYPAQVPGRTVHIDADFLAYQVTAEKADGSDDKTYEDMKHNAEVAVEAIRGLAAAEHVHLHLTPSTSNKGGRYEQALLKPYQGNREDKPKPKYLGIMREWLVKRYAGTLHQFCEADDGMSSSQYAALKRGEGHLSIIASKDKDLRMVPGLQLDWDTGAISGTEFDDEFGHVELVERRTAGGTVVKQLKGFGQKFFWAQMLIGDTADNISGLPAIPGHVMNFIKPTQEITKALDVVADAEASEEKRDKARAKLSARKEGLCGPVTAILILDMMQDARTAFFTTKGLYKRYGETTGFKHHTTGETVPWGQAFASEGKLLWMRENAHEENCVLDYWRRCAA